MLSPSSDPGSALVHFKEDLAGFDCLAAVLLQHKLEACGVFGRFQRQVLQRLPRPCWYNFLLLFSPFAYFGLWQLYLRCLVLVDCDYF